MNEFEMICRQLEERLAQPHNLKIEPARIPQAAVTLILCELYGLAQLLMIRRAERIGDPWSGHLALPGGRAEPQDRDLMATAARETCEEIGVDLLAGGRFIGQLSVISPNNPLLPKIEITPLVALAPPVIKMQLSSEVDKVFWVRLSDLKRTGLTGEYSMRFGEVIRRWPAYPTEEGPIWGITERILTGFFSNLV